MPKRKKTVIVEPDLEGQDDGQEAFTEIEDDTPPLHRPKKFKLNVTEDGVQFADEEQRQAFIEAAAQDADLIGALGDAVGEEEQDAGAFDPEAGQTIRTEHMVGLIDMVSMLEKQFVPRYVEKQTGKKLYPEVVDKAFTIPPDTKAQIAPGMAKLADDELPDWIKEYFAATNKWKPLAMYAGVLYLQIKALPTLQAIEEQRRANAPPPKPNGSAHPQPPPTEGEPL